MLLRELIKNIIKSLLKLSNDRIPFPSPLNFPWLSLLFPFDCLYIFYSHFSSSLFPFSLLLFLTRPPENQSSKFTYPQTLIFFSFSFFLLIFFLFVSCWKKRNGKKYLKLIWIIHRLMITSHFKMSDIVEAIINFQIKWIDELKASLK